MIAELDIVQQLVEIYEKYEWWSKDKMSFEAAIRYHKKRLDNGDIYVYEENGEVLGYYERYITGDTVLLHNLFIKEGHRRGKVFKELYRHFFQTLPLGIKYITGTKQKIGGKFQKVLIKGARYGR